MAKAVRYHKQGGPEVLQVDDVQVGDALLDLLRVEGRHRHAGQRYSQRPPQAAEHLERVLRRRLLSHGPDSRLL